MSTEYTTNELRILWYLKRHGPLTAAANAGRKGWTAIPTMLADELYLRRATVTYLLRSLEAKTLVLRTYKHPLKAKLGEGSGYNPMIKLELIDPNMWLPECPAPLPLGAVMAHENRDLYERVEHEPTMEAVMLALLDRNEVLQKQIDKLHEIVEKQQKELDTKAHQVETLRRPTKRDSHLMTRAKDVLPPEEWEKLTH